MAHSVKCATSAQVTLSQFVSLSPASGSVLMAQSLELAWDSVSRLSLSLFLSAPTPQLVRSLSLSKINIKKNKF